MKHDIFEQYKFRKRCREMMESRGEQDPSADTYKTIMLFEFEMNGHEGVMCAGVTEEGEKKTLGIREALTGSGDAAEELLDNLVRQGLRYEHRLVFGIESLVFQEAISRIFGDYADIVVVSPDPDGKLKII